MSSSAEPVPPTTGAGVRTFLIADVRGYTRFTLEQGDEAAATLATRFAAVADAVVRAHDGRVAELRGDEALAVFSSPRRALRAAVELQDRLTTATEGPIAAGIGLDAGEAIPVGDGFRGAALNLAARLCSLAGPGEILASDTIANLARKLDGLEYADRGAVQLKGFAEPVNVVRVQPSAGPAAPSVATVGTTLFEATLLHEYGRMEARAGNQEAARTRFEEALTLLRPMGAVALAEQVERELARL